MQSASEDRESSSHVSLPFPLAFFAWGLPLLWLLSVGHVAIDRLVLRSHDTWVLPGRFEDFFCYWGRLKLLHTEAFYTAPDIPAFGSGWGYPAPPIFIYRFFYLFDPTQALRPYRGYGFMVALTFSAILWMAVRLSGALQERGLRRSDAIMLAVVGGLLSWPLFLALQRGNIEMLLWIPVAMGIHAFTQRKWMTAAVLIGITASFKLYPIILLAIFLRERRFKEFAAGLVIALCMTLLGLLYIGPTFSSAAGHIGLGVRGFIEEHGAHINWWTEGYSHSLFHLLKMRLLRRGDLLQILIPRYMLTVAIVMTIVFFVRVIRMPPLNQVMVLCISMIYLPATSYDYTLLVLLVPWAWLALAGVSAAVRRETLAGFLPAMILFTLILGPEFFLTKRTYIYSGTLKSLCLGALMVIAVACPFRETSQHSSKGELAGLEGQQTLAD